MPPDPVAGSRSVSRGRSRCVPRPRAARRGRARARWASLRSAGYRRARYAHRDANAGSGAPGSLARRGPLANRRPDGGCRRHRGGEFGIDLLQMMEHAGAALAEAVMRATSRGPVTVLAGGSNNGGGLCGARHLADRCREVTIVLSSPPSASGPITYAYWPPWASGPRRTSWASGPSWTRQSERHRRRLGESGW